MTETSRPLDIPGAVDVLLDITGGDLDAARALITASHATLAANGTLTDRARTQFTDLLDEIAARREGGYPAWALDGETPVRVTVVTTHRRGTRVEGYDVSDGIRGWFTTQVWATADEAARVAGDLAHDLDL